MREIGGYFGLETFEGTDYYLNAVALDKARSCLLYIVKARKYTRIYLPDYLCDCVAEVLSASGVAVSFYPIDRHLQPIFSRQLSVDEGLYLVNYYGQLSNRAIQDYQKKYRNIIVDNTQAFFQPPVAEVDTFYTCRKFFGVPDGAYLFIDQRLDDVYPTDSSRTRMGHLLGRFEDSAENYYQEYQENEEQLDKNPIKKMSKLTANLLRAVPYEAIKGQRTQNMTVLSRELQAVNGLHYREVEGAFSYPLLVENGARIRKELAAKRIYLPTLWPNVIKTQAKSSWAYFYAQNILPLPCDQRYTKEDMIYLVKQLQPFLVKSAGEEKENENYY
ncbi:hypothetical protein [Enterococcus pallens]|uniref:DegT/DnrJ/EryC1/StrS aminotransferase n=1 Tax=Enterococcus pallens ATCC BAA-351 TaxID=1158607 RepID=R2QBI9_9ENTE|nr:hypothetical protein [Enterococcus pallens]EOH93792.1 hypothetical protein UAU_02488 [Enterococcus pallens ATCC BAA-351]EOU24632.1 hypothetical protein I588_00619 [Enterococcus pallens ATCC BAA-351]OJG79546.1 hypothetical protein RV10_GL000673 [Enterococcus pallens]